MDSTDRVQDALHIGSLSQIPWLLGFALFALTLTSAHHLTTRGRRRLPGPKGLPFIGSAFALPKEEEWLVYQGWSSQYGTRSLHAYPYIPLEGRS